MRPSCLDRQRARRIAEARAHRLHQFARVTLAAFGVGLTVTASGLLAIAPKIEGEALSAMAGVAGVVLFPCGIALAIVAVAQILENWKG